ncbi:MAG TPA: hypothetical protein VMV10_08815 [Pirellulales bacterium]|nr:hypothetical protein [Pirellulales bacterium]
MALPAFSEARPFYRAALERFEDAEFLYQVNRNTAGTLKSKDAKSFLDAALEIIKGADGRL